MTDDIAPPPGLSLTREGDRLSVRAQSGGLFYFFGASVAALGVLLVLVLVTVAVREEELSDPELAVGLAVGLVLVVLGVLIARPRTTRTTFDLGQARMHQQSGRWRRQRGATWPFADIAGLGVEETNDGSISYAAFVKHRDGTTADLGANSTHYPSHAHLIDTLCQATGLPRLEMPVNKAWFEDAAPAHSAPR